jgi:hypothetical protein
VGGLADLLGEDLGEASGARNSNSHHGRLRGPLLHLGKGEISGVVVRVRL